MKKEIWKDIKGYEGFYQISNFGKVKSLTRLIIRKNNNDFTLKGKLLKSANNGNYDLVVLTKDKKRKTHTVHQLVALNFIPNPNRYKEINHIDGNKKNNFIENLEWCTHEENMKHAFANGLVSIISGVNHPHSKPVKQLNKDGTLVKIWGNVKTAEKHFNPNGRDNISAVVNGRRKTYMGYKWELVQV